MRPENLASALMPTALAAAVAALAFMGALLACVSAFGPIDHPVDMTEHERVEVAKAEPRSGASADPGMSLPGQSESQGFTDSESIELTSLAISATVRVSSKSCGEGVIGSGFLVDETIITNRHLVVGSTDLKIEGGDGVSLVPLVGVSTTSDLAAAGPVSGLKLVVSVGSVQVGDPVMIAGRPGGGPVVALSGVVQRVGSGEVYGVDGPVMFLEVETSPGFSGGPVFDRSGNVVGVLQAFDHTTGLTLAVPLAEVREFYSGLESPVSAGDGTSDSIVEGWGCGNS